MCRKVYKLPSFQGRKWQYVCIKANGSVAYKGTGNCARFCSPDNVMFERIAEVRRHHQILLRRQNTLEKQKKKLNLEKKRREKEIRMKVSLMKNKESKKPTLPQILEKQKVEKKENKKTRKSKCSSRPKVPKEKITTQQIRYFLGLKEYPIIVNQVNLKLWEDTEKFRKFYLPLVYLANPGVPFPLLETYLQAKWREIMALKENHF